MKSRPFVRNYLRLLGSARNRFSSLQNYANRSTRIEKGLCYMHWFAFVLVCVQQWQHSKEIRNQNLIAGLLVLTYIHN